MKTTKKNRYFLEGTFLAFRNEEEPNNILLYGIRQAGKTVTGGEEYRISRNKYNSFALIYCTKGSIKLDYLGNTYTANEGDLLFFNQNILHVQYRPKNSQLNTHYMYIYGHDIDKFWNVFFKEYGCVLKNFKEGEQFIKITDEIAISVKNNTENKYRTSSLIYDILLNILSYCDNTNILDKEISNAVNLINEEYYKPQIMDLILSNTFYSKYHFCRKFHSEIGQSPKEYIDTVRLNHAIKYLRETDLKLEEIAEKIGSSVKAVNRLFKSHYDMTANQFKKRGNI